MNADAGPDGVAHATLSQDGGASTCAARPADPFVAAFCRLNRPNPYRRFTDTAPRGTDHCVMVVKDEHDRILITHEAESENAHSPELRGEAYPHASKASRGEDLQIEHPVACRDFASFDFHPTLASVLGPTLIGDQV